MGKMLFLSLYFNIILTRLEIQYGCSRLNLLNKRCDETTRNNDSFIACAQQCTVASIDMMET